MTDKEKLIKIKKLADAMYYGAFNMTTDASLLKKAMKEYRQFTIHEYCKEEPVSIWHDASEKSNKAEDVVVINPSDNTGEVLTGCIKVYQGRIWAYTSILLNLDNPRKIRKNLQEEPVSEELENAADNALNHVLNTHEIVNIRSCLEMFRFGAKWKEKKMMVNATEVTVHIDAGGYPYIPQMELYDYDKDAPLAKAGEKVKVIVIK